MANHVERALSMLAECLASYARIEAMKAANAARSDQGYAQAYAEESFWIEASELERIAAQAAGGDDE